MLCSDLGRAYEWLKRELEIPPGETGGINTWKLLFAGGLAGTLSWASIYPLGNACERVDSCTAIEGPIRSTHTHLLQLVGS
jgi:solute carrier family 25 carnitine/acylcarnitine transporter 20/29